MFFYSILFFYLGFFFIESLIIIRRFRFGVECYFVYRVFFFFRCLVEFGFLFTLFVSVVMWIWMDVLLSFYFVGSFVGVRIIFYEFSYFFMARLDGLFVIGVR